MSIDFKDYYFHFPIQTSPGSTYIFMSNINPTNIKYYHFGLSHGIQGCVKGGQTDELHKSVIIHQYLGDWLVRARSHQTCFQYTQTLVALFQELGLMLNMENQNWTPNKSLTS